MSLPDEGMVARLPIPTVDALIESIFYEESTREFDNTHLHIITYGEPGYGKSFIVDPMDCAWGDLYAEWEAGQDYAHDEDGDE